METNTTATQVSAAVPAEPAAALVASPVPAATQTPTPPTDQAAAQPKTQEDEINGRITRESRKQVEALLKEAGIMPDDDPKMQLKAYKEWQDAQKSDLEKAQGDAKNFAGERDAALAELQSMKRCMMAISKGVPADKAERYVKFAETYVGEDGDYGKALEAVLKDFPIATEKQVTPQIVLGATRAPSETKKQYKPPKVI